MTHIKIGDLVRTDLGNICTVEYIGRNAYGLKIVIPRPNSWFDGGEELRKPKSGVTKISLNE